MKKYAISFASAVLLSTSIIFPTYANSVENQSIFFSGGSLDQPAIYQLNSDTLETTKLLSGHSVHVSPDGTKLAFVRNDSIYISDSNGKNIVRLTHSTFPNIDSSPRWSPDGSKIVFARSNGNLYIIDVASKLVKQLTQASQGVYHSKPDWSPDGKTIVFHAADPFGYSHIYSVSVDGTNIKQLTGLSGEESSEFDAHFSPDGTKIVYNASKDGNVDIYVMNRDGSQPVNLTADTNEVVSSPIWSNDGKSILYTINEQNEGVESTRFAIMNRDGSNKKVIRLRVPFATPSDWQIVKEIKEEQSTLQSTLSKIKQFFLND